MIIDDKIKFVEILLIVGGILAAFKYSDDASTVQYFVYFLLSSLAYYSILKSRQFRGGKSEKEKWEVVTSFALSTFFSFVICNILNKTFEETNVGIFAVPILTIFLVALIAFITKILNIENQKLVKKIEKWVVRIVILVIVITVLVGVASLFLFSQNAKPPTNIQNESLCNCQKNIDNLNYTYYLNACYEREKSYNEIIESYKNLLNASEENCTEIIKIYQNIIDAWKGNYTELAAYCLSK